MDHGYRRVGCWLTVYCIALGASGALERTEEYLNQGTRIGCDRFTAE
jgi:hypothetical protein